VNGALRELIVALCRGNFLAYRASVGMLARSSGASFPAGLSVPTDECMELSCVVYACDVLLACACLVHVEFLSAPVDAHAAVDAQVLAHPPKIRYNLKFVVSNIHFKTTLAFFPL
jgi:hypothetical protein